MALWKSHNNSISVGLYLKNHPPDCDPLRRLLAAARIEVTMEGLPQCAVCTFLRIIMAMLTTAGLLPCAGHSFVDMLLNRHCLHLHESAAKCTSPGVWVAGLQYQRKPQYAVYPFVSAIANQPGSQKALYEICDYPVTVDNEVFPIIMIVGIIISAITCILRIVGRAMASSFGWDDGVALLSMVGFTTTDFIGRSTNSYPGHCDCRYGCRFLK